MTDNILGEMPKASIGNYKGVMLCNRPDEFGLQRRPEKSGPPQFYARVDCKNANPVGWNPCPRLFPRIKKKKNVFLEVLNRHKAYIKTLEIDRAIQREEAVRVVQDEEERKRNFMAKAQEQRQKIYSMKNNTDEILKEFDMPNYKEIEGKIEAPRKLTQENLSKMDEKSQKGKAASQKSKASKKSQKPAWAMTEDQLEE
jgi:hypothetical protein